MGVILSFCANAFIEARKRQAVMQLCIRPRRAFARLDGRFDSESFIAVQHPMNDDRSSMMQPSIIG